MDPLQANLDELVALIPPPEAPLVATKPWEAVFNELGTALPADFVALIERYGAFEVGRMPEDDQETYVEFLGVSDPRTTSGGVTWAEAAAGVGDTYRTLRERRK